MSDVLLLNTLIVHNELSLKNLLQNYDAFDLEGWAVGVVVSTKRYCITNKSVGVSLEVDAKMYFFIRAFL